MKVRILLASIFALASVQAFANCAGDSGGDATITAAATPAFIKSDFTMKCSKNVFLNYLEDDVKVGVCANSVKGKFKGYGGSSEGGAIKLMNSTTCDSTGCADADADADVNGCKS